VDDRERIARLDSLSELECQTLYWLCRGLTRVEMADELCISESTVYKRMAGVWQKTGVDHLSGTQRLQALVQEFCPLILERVEDPERDCQQRSGVSHIPDLEPDQETVEIVEEDERNGIIPITQAIATRQSNQDSRQDIIVIPVNDESRRKPLPPWLVPALLGAVIVLLAMNLLRTQEPVAPEVLVVTATQPPATATEAVAQSADQPTTEPTAAAPTPSPPPTNPPAATYTPYPTPTLYPTHTPYPTEVPPTSIPSPTVVEITPSDAVLEVGEWWKQDGVWLRIADVEFTESGWIHMGLELWNKTGQMLLFEWSPDQNTKLTDNVGNKYEEDCRTRALATEKYAIAERRNLFMPGCGESTDYRGDGYFSASVTELTLVMSDISRIDHAEFRIPVPK